MSLGLTFLSGITDFTLWLDNQCENRAQSFVSVKTTLGPDRTAKPTTDPTADPMDKSKVVRVVIKRYLKCNRGGNERPTQSSGIRLLKSQGSCKLNRPCTAEIVSVAELKLNQFD